MSEVIEIESFLQSSKCKSMVKWILFYWLLGGLLYLSLFVDIIPNPDAIWNGVYYKSAYIGEITLGRWGIGLMQKLRGGVINPSFITISGLLYVAIIAFLVTQIFSVNTVLGKAMVGILTIYTPHIVSTLTYYYCSDIYLFSYLLAVLSVWLLVKEGQNKIRRFFATIVCILFSIGIYQSYICVTILFCSFYLLIMIFNNEEPKTVVKKGSYMLFSGIIGISGYLIVTKMIQAVWNVEAVDARGFSTMGKISIVELIRGIVNSYRYFLTYYFGDTLINNSWGNRRAINIVFFIQLFIILVCVITKIKTGLRGKTMALVLICLMPVFFMCIVIMAPHVSIKASTGVLMLPGMSYIYILPILLWHRLEIPKKLYIVSGYCSLIVMLLVMNMLFVLNLSAQTYMQYSMRKTYFVASEMVSEIERLGINTEDYRLCIIGFPEDGNYPDNQGELKESVSWLTASYRMVWSDDNGRNYCWKYFLNQFIGKDYQICDWETTKKLRESEEVMSMSNFPEQRSIKIIGDIIVVKLG